jgi:hypothetical protein
MVKKKNIVNIKTVNGRKVPTGRTVIPGVWNPFNTVSDANRLFLNDPWTSPWLRHWGWRRPWAGLVRI